MGTPRAVVKNTVTAERIRIRDLLPGDFGVFNTGRVVYRPFGSDYAQAFDGGYFMGATLDAPIRKLKSGEVVEITIR